jgi:putative sigma-54 modulation protein
MQVIVKGRHMDVTPALRNHAEEKAQKLTRYLDRIREVEVIIYAQKAWQTAEVNLYSDLVEVRAQERSQDMYESIDLVMKKLEKQLRRFKERLKSHPHNSRDMTQAVAERAASEMINEQRTDNGFEEETEEESRIVRTKRLQLKPISPEEAADQMELVGHDFYVFLNADDQQVNVLYRRNDGHYGLIQPTEA